ncbi:uncharacterized protein N7473_007075 [Penicillium subrubescens]|uniref:Uncharacterized protein n=1 Tax=Penicillium subrubescens TaxID=1316194 RepID=A0A1Q5TGB2_9EURO|nr:uncharacterized protein N7473_007075 [Penicillium subrubescens]KAJ5890847.1 hypothetical protein N7473_007075 [Penicillium subrubescens]OKO99278.1 hypothetical protein PENSUB_8665 [Penicillium subrubescens]
MSQSRPKPKKQPTTWKEPVKPKPQVGWIWPKDPRPGNPTRWSRFKRFSDVLTGKGPDIYVGTIGKRPPPMKDNDNPGRAVSSTNWARWDIEPEEDDTPFPWAHRPKNVKYDYNTRKYKFPDEKTWSAVEYADYEWECGKNRRKKKVTPSTPIRFWDRHGRVHWCHGQGQDEWRGSGRRSGCGGPSGCGGGHGGGCHGHCHCGLHEHDSALGSYEHLHGHPYPVRSHCPDC